MSYPTFIGKSKSGRGKLFYGLTQKKLDQLKSIRVDTDGQLCSYSDNLFGFVNLYLRHAIYLAKSNQKDEARNWLRFFQNSQVIELLASLPSGGNVDELRKLLFDLSTACHPLDQATWSTDIEAIRHCLNEILSYVQTKPDTRPVHGRFDCRRHGIKKTDSKNFDVPARRLKASAATS